jgi:uncharacterized protein (TIGR02246 family)
MTDETAIDSVLSRYVETWRTDDMDGWGGLFTDDSDFVTHGGVWWKSKHENVSGHKAVPDAVSRQKPRYRLDRTKACFLTPDIALVHATWQWPGFVQSPGDEPADRSGIVTMVMVRQDGRWLIRASHNSRTT